MHSTGSILYTVRDRCRNYLDEGAVNAKFPDAELFANFLHPALSDVWSRLNMSGRERVVLRADVTPVATQEYYILPPCVGMVVAVRKMDDNGNLLFDAKPRSIHHPYGPNWALEGNQLTIRPFPGDGGQPVQVWYVHNGNCGYHYGVTGAVSASNLVLTLAANVTIGVKDRRANAYAGQMLRMLPDTGVQQETIISTHDASAGTVSPRTAFSPSLAGQTGLKYEIVPPTTVQEAFSDAWALAAALRMAAVRKITPSQDAMIRRTYLSACKTLKDTVANLESRVGKAFDRCTIDNPGLGMPFISAYPYP